LKIRKTYLEQVIYGIQKLFLSGEQILYYFMYFTG